MSLYDLGAVPVNREAAFTGLRGVEYRRVHSGRPQREFDAPPPMRRFTYAEKLNPCNVDYAGTRRGRLVAVGIFAEAPYRWVMRCDCGAYVLRKARCVGNERNTHDACQECRHLMFRKREDHYRRTGKDLPIESFC